MIKISEPFNIITKDKNGTLYGVYNPDGSVKITKGSYFRNHETNTLLQVYRNKRAELINNNYVNNGIFIKDYVFKNSCEAYCCCFGRQDNGIAKFYTIDGIELVEFLNSMRDKINSKRHYLEEDDELGVIDSFDIDFNDTYLPEFKPVEIVKIKYDEKERIARSIKRAKGAIIRANYKCNIDESHQSFISKRGKPYMEAHHLIPLSAQDNFSYGLDADANIVCLCPNCHRNLHYGKDIKDMLNKLYDLRVKELEESGINISFDELLELYK